MKRKMALAAAGACVILVLSGGAAYAVSSSVVDSSGVIHGCVSNVGLNGTHLLVVRDTARSCPKRTTELDWNQQGPAGPSTAGPAGLDVIQVSVASASSLVEVATCPIDHPYLVGGGGSGGGWLSASQPETTGGSGSPNAWIVRGTNNLGPLEADALCAK